MKRTFVQRSGFALQTHPPGQLSRIAKNLVRSLLIGAFLCGIAWHGTQDNVFAQTRNQLALESYHNNNLGTAPWRPHSHYDYMDGAIYGSLAGNSIMNTSTTLGTLNNYLRRGEFGGFCGGGCMVACDPCGMTACDPYNMSACDPCGTTACDPYSMSACDPCGYEAYDPNGGGYGCDSGCGMIYTSRRNCRNLWGLAYGTGGKTQHDGNAYGYKQGYFGTIVGIDRLYGNTTRAGMYVSYGEGRISNDLDQRADSKQLLVGFYLRKEMRIGYLILNGGLGYDQYNTARTVDLLKVPPTVARGKPSAFVGTVYGERGLNICGCFFNWQPFVAMQYIGNQRESFTERGGTSMNHNLSGNRMTTSSLRSLLGTRVSKDLARTHRGTLSMFGQAIWMHEFLSDTSPDFTGKFALYPNSGTFTVDGNNTGRDWAIIGTGLTYDTKQWRLFAGYDITMNGRQVLHTGNAGASYGW